MLPWQLQSSCGERQLFPKSLQVLLMSLTEVHHLREENESDSHASGASQLARAWEVDSSLIPVSQQGWNLANAPGWCYKDSVSMSTFIPLRPIMHCHKKCRLPLFVLPSVSLQLGWRLLSQKWGDSRPESRSTGKPGQVSTCTVHVEEPNQLGQDLP